MTVMRTALLGVVQGLTEFLPVSSSGHLAIAHRLLGTDMGLIFDIGVHVGTALAVIVVFRAEIYAMVAALVRGIGSLIQGRSSVAGIAARDRDFRLVLLLVTTTVPAGMAGFVLRDVVEGAFGSMAFVAIMLFITGGLLWYADQARARTRSGPLSMNFADALVVGIAQAAAIFPGLSRSGATITAGISRGLERGFAASYSFIASVPVILGAGLLEFARSGASIARADIYPFAVGIGVSFVSGLFAVVFLLSVVRKRRLRAFSYYVWAVATAVLVLEATGGLGRIR